MDKSSSFGHWLKHRRSELDLSRQELAVQVGCTVETIRKIEHNKRRPSKQLAQRLLRFLNVSQNDYPRLLHLARTLSETKPTQNPTHHTDYPPHNLSTPTTPLIGRDDEVAQGVKLLLHNDVRLVTLSGAPGVGKTRVGVGIAHTMYTHFEEGVYFVNLASITDSTLIPSTILQTLGINEGPEHNPLERLISRLCSQRMLLLLDNFEHLMEATSIVINILSRAPKVKLLITSRILLRISGEYEFPIYPLPLPSLQRTSSLDYLTHNPSVALFIARTKTIKPHFALTEMNALTVAHICVQLDGLPLAIELAAARSKLFTPQELLARLTTTSQQQTLQLLTNGAVDLPLRQQTLRSTIAWSYQLLDPAARVLFAQLGVFCGSFTFDAIEAICKSDNQTTSIPITDTVTTLLDGSLLIRMDNNTQETRFRMLETIREFATEQFETRPDVNQIRHNHAIYYATLSETIYSKITSPQQGLWFARMDAEHPNVRSAYAWALAQQDSNLAWRFGSRLWLYWMLRGYITEGRRWLAQTRTLNHDHIPQDTYLRLISGAAGLAMRQGNHSETHDLLQEILLARKQNNDIQGIATVLSNMGMNAFESGNYVDAREFTEKALELWHHLESINGIRNSLTYLGIIALEEGAYQQALDLLNNGLKVAQKDGIPSGIARILTYLGLITHKIGSRKQAQHYLIEGLALWCHSENTSEVVEHLDVMLYTLVEHTQTQKVIQLCAATETLRDELGISRRPHNSERFSTVLTMLRTHIDQNTFITTWDIGRNLSFEQIVQLARELAIVHLEQVVDIRLSDCENL